VAPLGTALVVVGVGVALALAKAQRERRSTAAAVRARRDRRRPSLRKSELLAEGLQRVILGQLDLAIELLEAYPDGTARAQTNGSAAGGSGPGEETVHETRKALKRLRALLALLRDELGPKRYARENATLRDCARRLAGARDAEVMLGTLDTLLRSSPAKLARSAAIRTLRAELHTEREAAAALAIRDPRVREEVLDELRAVRARVERWELRERGFKLLAPGLERIYRRGRRGLRTARRRGGVEALHKWRKTVKELRYVAETMDRGGKSASGSANDLRRIARDADHLGELLGEEHDLALLQIRVRKRSQKRAGERKARKRLLKLIARRRKSLRKRAMREGERLYRRKPRRFVRRLKRPR
jgi:CHAD domain-containing protein